METDENRSKEAGHFPIQKHETHIENKMATDHLTPTNPGDHRSAVFNVQSIAVRKVQETVTSLLKSIGVTTDFIGEDQQDDQAKKAVGRRDCEIVLDQRSHFSSDRWKKMLLSTVYEERLCLIAVDETHCISHWQVR